MTDLIRTQGLGVAFGPSVALTSVQWAVPQGAAVQLGVVTALSSLTPLLLAGARSTPAGLTLWDRVFLGLAGDTAVESIGRSAQMAAWLYALGLVLIPLTALLPQSPIVARMLSRSTLARIAFVSWLRETFFGLAAIVGTAGLALALFWLPADQPRPDRLPLFLWVTALFVPLAPWWTAFTLHGGVPSFQDNANMSHRWPKVLATFWLGGLLAWGLVRCASVVQSVSVGASALQVATGWAVGVSLGALGVHVLRRLFQGDGRRSLNGADRS